MNLVCECLLGCCMMCVKCIWIEIECKLCFYDLFVLGGVEVVFEFDY